MIRDFARAAVVVIAVLFILAEVQQADDAAGVAAHTESAPPARANNTDF